MSHRDRHSSGDRYASTGYWGPSTSTANFCEEDYAVAIHVVEFINTLTSLAYVYFAVRHPRSPPKPVRFKHSPFTQWTVGDVWQEVQNRHEAYGHFDSMSFSLLLVGITSLIYHATLCRMTEVVVELSVLTFATSLTQRLYTFGQAPSTRNTTRSVLFITVTVLSTMYIRSGNIFYPTSVLTGLLALIFSRTVYLLCHLPRSDQRTSRLKRRLVVAVSALTIGFVVWNVDSEKCLELRAVRDEVGLPWAWLLEGHGWWHILTAFGASEYIRLVRELCNE